MHSNSIAISSSSSSERNSITDLLIQLPHARQALLKLLSTNCICTNIEYKATKENKGGEKDSRKRC